MEYSPKVLRVMKMIPEGGYWRDLPEGVAKEAMGGAYGSGGGQTGMFRRLHRDLPSLTLVGSPAQKQTMRGHPTEDRPINVAESAAIQSFTTGRSTMKDHSKHTVVDLFAGVGVGVACQNLGVKELGVEWMPEANALREANGMTTIYENVWDAHILENMVEIGLEFDTLWASPPCFTAGAPVATHRGVVPIEDVLIGDLVLTHMGRWRSVTATMNRMADTVTFGNVTATPDHPFYAARQWRKWNNDRRSYDWGVGEPSWIDASETHGAFLSIPVRAESEDERTPGIDWWLVGRWVADGWGQPSRQEVCIAVGKGKEAAFESHAGDGWKAYPMPTSVTRYTKHGGDDISWLVQHFGTGAHGKTVPGWLLSQPEAARQAFLDGYLSGDGTATRSGSHANTVSLNLATGIRLVAESLGYTTSLEFNKKEPTTVIQGRTVNQSSYWGVSINRNDGRYSRTRGIHRWVKQRKKVVPSGRQRVYDITVEEDHSFTAWGYVVHNCQSYSTAGNGAGRKALDDVLAVIHDKAYLDMAELRERSEALGDERIGLVLSPLHYAMRFKPTFIAFEQVPPVLPVWEAMAAELREAGYSVWTGYLQAEMYGVPQTRKRAFLMARNDGKEVKPPVPTHSRYYSRTPEKLDPGVKKWVSMAEALSWNVERPAPTVTGGGTATGGAEPFGRRGRDAIRRARGE